MIKAILLDLDETVLQSEKATADLFNIAVKNVLNDYVSGMEFRQVYRRHCFQSRDILTCNDMLQQIGIGSYDCFFIDEICNVGIKELHEYRNIVYKKVSQELKIKESLVLNISQFLYNHWLDYYSLYTDSLDFFNMVSKNMIYIATNGLRTIQYQKIKKFNLDDVVKNIFISQDFGIGKPNRQYFNSILKSIPQASDEIIMIGDNILNDVEGAVTSGFHAIHLCRSSSKKQDNVVCPKYQVSGFQEVLEVLVDVFRLKLS